MKFLSKYIQSEILARNITYKNGDNIELKELLLKEQKNFCAYTEKFIENLDTVHIEHFNSYIKGNDDYYNYYAVLGKANLYKKDEKYEVQATANLSFFASHFFQTKEIFNARIEYYDNFYFEIDENDNEAIAFIDFLDLNNEELRKQRKNEVERLRFLFNGWPEEKKISYLKKFKQELSFVTAIEIELNLDLSDIVNS